MESYGDFIQCLEPDMSIKILMCLEDPADLVRVSSVSTLWRQFVIANEFCKHLSVRMFPEISSIAHDIEENNMIEAVESSTMAENHKVYAILGRGLSSLITSHCILKALGASSTDNYPDESIRNTLERGDRGFQHRPSYWSSKGASDPTVPEGLLYTLISNLCVITEIHIQPFQAFFQFGFPIYSAKAVRFRMGHPRFANDVRGEPTDDSAAAFSNDKFVWTYTSPLFPMAQEKRLQEFKLPQPVLCIGGVLLIELVGRVQRQAMDGLYYICIAHVEVVGRPLSPMFKVDNGTSGKWALKYHPKEAEEKICNHNNSFCSCAESELSGGSSSSSSPFRLRTLTASIRGWLLGGATLPNPLLSLIQPPNIVSQYDYDDNNNDTTHH